MEEVVGEIRDEFDERHEILYRQLDEYTFLFDGKTLINDVCRFTDLNPMMFDDVRGNPRFVALAKKTGALK